MEAMEELGIQNLERFTPRDDTFGLSFSSRFRF